MHKQSSAARTAFLNKGARQSFGKCKMIDTPCICNKYVGYYFKFSLMFMTFFLITTNLSTGVAQVAIDLGASSKALMSGLDPRHIEHLRRRFTIEASQASLIDLIYNRCLLIENGNDPDLTEGLAELMLAVEVAAKNNTETSFINKKLTEGNCSIKNYLMEQLYSPFRATDFSDNYVAPADSKPEQFTWPPPEPNIFAKISNKFLFDKDKLTYGDVSDKFKYMLKAAGYDEFRYFPIGDDGFAMVTRLEKIHDSGQPYKTGNRWVDGIDRSHYEHDNFSLRDHLLNLFYPRSGRFRLIILLSTPRDLYISRKALSMDVVNDWEHSGTYSLPFRIEHSEYNINVNSYILIYEFEKLESRVPRIKKSGMTVREHLAASGISSGGLE